MNRDLENLLNDLEEIEQEQSARQPPKESLVAKKTLTDDTELHTTANLHNNKNSVIGDLLKELDNLDISQLPAEGQKYAKN